MAKKKPASPPPTFEESIAQLERVVGELESGNLGLAESLGHYEAGVKHLKSCYLLLEQAERKIELLSGVDASGNPISEPFTAGEEAARDDGSGEPTVAETDGNRDFAKHVGSRGRRGHAVLN